MTQISLVNKARMKKSIKGFLILIVSICILSVIVGLFLFKDKSTKDILLYTLLVFTIMIGTACFAMKLDGKLLTSTRRMLALCTNLILNATIMLCLINWLKIGYLMPLSLCALICGATMDSKSAFLMGISLVITIFAAEVLFNASCDKALLYYLLFDGLFCSIIASYVSRKHFTRGKYTILGLFLGLASAVFAAITYLMFTPIYNFAVMLVDVGYAFASGILTIMLILILMPLFEGVFNLVTDFRLAELCDTGKPLLRRLFAEAPGTFNHSTTVANYAEACAQAIGSNPFLARAAAYYHDIGKLKNPLFFIENQGGISNPHDELTPEASIVAIKKHVVYGIALAKEYRLPEDICKGVAEHHGTMPIKYFYLKAKKLTDGELPYDDYRYAGPTPTTKTSAILMICDACEAALRASGNKNNAAQIVSEVVKERMDFNQFLDCDISMKEIETIKKTILSTYIGVTHERIEYPEVSLK